MSKDLLLAIRDRRQRTLLQSALTPYGYDCSCITSPEELFKKLSLNTNQWHALIIDEDFIKPADIERVHTYILPIMVQSNIPPAHFEMHITAGARYYLIPPFQQDWLASLPYEGRYQFRTLEEATALAQHLATATPEPLQAMIGIKEIFFNAIEHGNLGIDYATKSQLLKENRWHPEIRKRLDSPLYADNYVDVTCTREGDCLKIRVVDKGCGFDWKAYTQYNADRQHHSHGRGILMAHHLSFKELIYQGAGNEVVCVLALQPSKTAV